VLVWKLFVSKFDSKRKTLGFVLLLVLIASLSKPFINRLDELRNTELDIIGQKEYVYDTPFNGITLRLVLWGFGSEILSENNAWLKGTGIQSKQELLNRKIEESGMYTGNPEFGDRGYLDYNFHNQYVETLVGTGIVGLVILLFLILDIFAGVRYKLIFPLPVYILTAMFFLTESVLERQAGIVFFCLIACTYLLTNTLESQSVGSRSE
jgi:O-antigen ligase